VSPFAIAADHAYFARRDGGPSLARLLDAVERLVRDAAQRRD
jgi:hypothetical protein